MSGISREDVAHLAALARISLTDAESEHFAEQLAVILGAVARVQEVAGEDVAATSHPLPLTNVTRPDQARIGLTPQEALSGAPAAEEQRFRVPQILGEEA
jgi:aspartyl-tRNA(Asn)/glutamyl-tRNA(Gln) amidotransferase subunit C